MVNLLSDLKFHEPIAVTGVELALSPEPHPFELQNKDAINAHWREEQNRNNRLFDGRLVLFTDLAILGAKLVGTAHEARFATLLYWRSQQDNSEIIHCFGHAALLSSEGDFVAIRMGAHTANAGKVYFAAGSLELEDFVGRKADLDRNMAREVFEETGLQLNDYAHEAGYQVMISPIGVVVFRRYRLSMTGEEIAARIRSHIESDPDPEISEPVLIRAAGPEPEGFLAHMRRFRSWHAKNPEFKESNRCE